MKKYIIEPRNEDGTLNAKLIAREPFRNNHNGMTEDEIFEIYFADNKQKETASWGELRQYFKDLGGYQIREKNW